MGIFPVLLAKTAALKRNFEQIKYREGRCLDKSVEYLFPRYISIIQELKKERPDLFSDIPELEIPNPIGTTPDGRIYQQEDILPLINNLDYIMELNSNLRIGEIHEEKSMPDKIFISHGRSNEWYKVQNYLERDLALFTLELAQEPNIGRTVLQKLDEESNKCRIAVIVMTGDDLIEDGELRSRENVMHEIGFFQGKLGLHNIVLLHEEGVNIPSNIHGLVYIGFPKDTVEATFGAITRELKILMS